MNLTIKKLTSTKLGVLIILLALILLILALTILKAQEPIEKSHAGKTVVASVQTSKENVLAKLSQFEGIAQFINDHTEVTYISDEELPALAEKQPVLYANLTAPVYRIVLNAEGKSLLLLYDFNSNKILKKFEVTNLSIK